MSKEILRLQKKLANRDKRIAGLDRKVQQLETALCWRTIDLEKLTRNIHDEVVRALCSVRMIPDRQIPNKTKP
jgi:hypothetical protein